MHGWTSRRRVEAALNFEQPDRVPLDMTITLNAYRALREALGLPPEESIRANRFYEVEPAPEVLGALGLDITFVKLRGPANWSAPPPAADGTLTDEWGVGYRRVETSPGVYLLEASSSPFAGLHPTEIDLDAYPWPDPHDPGRTAGLAEHARGLYEGTDLALMGRFGGTIMEQAAFLRGYQDWLMDLALYPDFARALMERIADIQIALDEAGLRAAGPMLSIFKLSGEDLGMQDRPLFSPQMWRGLLRPILARRWRAARAVLDEVAPHVKLMLHSDGAIRSFLPDLIEDGIDIIDPVQVSCVGMEPAGLKQDFGGRLAFHGGVDTQHVLPFGTPGEVRAHVRAVIEALGMGGGLILAPVHNVQADVPPDNLIALFDEARNFRTTH